MKGTTIHRKSVGVRMPGDTVCQVGCPAHCSLHYHSDQGSLLQMYASSSTLFQLFPNGSKLSLAWLASKSSGALVVPARPFFAPHVVCRLPCYCHSVVGLTDT